MYSLQDHLQKQKQINARLTKVMETSRIISKHRQSDRNASHCFKTSPKRRTNDRPNEQTRSSERRPNEQTIVQTTSTQSDRNASHCLKTSPK